MPVTSKRSTRAESSWHRFTMLIPAQEQQHLAAAERAGYDFHTVDSVPLGLPTAAPGAPPPMAGLEADTPQFSASDRADRGRERRDDDADIRQRTGNTFACSPETGRVGLAKFVIVFRQRVSGRLRVMSVSSPSLADREPRAATLAAPASCHPQGDWPKGPIKIILPFPPGGARSDPVARASPGQAVEEHRLERRESTTARRHRRVARRWRQGRRPTARPGW